MLPYRIKEIYNPEIFQGHRKTNRYFEGWYFKLADRQTENVFAVIPGVSISDIKNDSHSFIQVMDGINAKSRYFRFDFKDFTYSTDRFNISIGSNSFSDTNLKLNLQEGNEIYKADLEFSGLNKWPSSLLSPGAMGWYAFVPFMECYHGVVSMNHNISGTASFAGKTIDFSGGKGYIEKDWGQSFPEGWIWLQSNHFKNDMASIMFSVARIPWKKKSFTGFICGLLHNKKILVFATYNGSKIKHLAHTSDSFRCIIENSRHSLSIEAEKQKGATLLSPIFGAMDGRINESIDAIVKISLEKKSGITTGKKETPMELIYEDTGYFGGLEIINPEVLDR